jgi:hypothetical protein
VNAPAGTKAPGWLIPERVDARHREIVKLDGQRLPVPWIAERVGLCRSMVYRHLKGACHCGEFLGVSSGSAGL